MPLSDRVPVDTEKQLVLDREEIRILFSDGNIPLDKLTEEYRSKTYDRPYTTTLYFGFAGKNWKGLRTARYLAIKARAYTARDRGNLFLVSPSTPCVIEIKKRSRSRFSHYRKMRLSEEEVITYGDLLKLIDEVFTLRKRFEVKFREVGRELRRFVKRNKITSISPIGATTYKRTHKELDDHRITIDQKVRYFCAVKHEGEVIFSHVKTEVAPRLEIKRLKTSTIKPRVIANIEARSISYSETTESKGFTLMKLFSEEYGEGLTHAFIEPELDLKADNDWVITEREIKLDAPGDPRPIVDSALFDSAHFYPGKPVSEASCQKILNVGPSGIFILADENQSPRLLKYKEKIGTLSDGQIVRKEIVAPYSQELVNELAAHHAKKQPYEASPFFWRNRVKFLMYATTSRNVFEIYADHSVFEDNTSEPFNQVEIEYVGIVGDKSRVKIKESTFLQSIQYDFDLLKKHILQQFEKNGMSLTLSYRTKYDWAKKEIFTTDA